MSARTIKYMWKNDLAGTFRPAFTEFVNTWLAGELPKEAAQFLNAALLIALKKGTTDVRPIAIGDILRRIVHKMAMVLVGDSGAEILGDLQFGVSPCWL